MDALVWLAVVVHVDPRRQCALLVRADHGEVAARCDHARVYDLAALLDDRDVDCDTTEVGQRQKRHAAVAFATIRRRLPTAVVIVRGVAGQHVRSEAAAVGFFASARACTFTRVFVVVECDGGRGIGTDLLAAVWQTHQFVQRRALQLGRALAVARARAEARAGAQVDRCRRHPHVGAAAVDAHLGRRFGDVRRLRFGVAQPCHLGDDIWARGKGHDTDQRHNYQRHAKIDGAEADKPTIHGVFARVSACLVIDIFRERYYRLNAAATRSVGAFSIARWFAMVPLSFSSGTPSPFSCLWNTMSDSAL